MKQHTATTEDNATLVTGILNTLLADESLLYQKTRNYHWNVTGMNFHSLHVFFEEQYTILADTIDEVAEWVRKVGGFAIGTLQEYLEITRLSETPGERPEATQMIRNLLADYETIISHLREDIATLDEDPNNVSTVDFLVGIVEQHQKAAWMLRAHIE